MQTINLDLSVRSIIPLLHAKQGDVGRKFKAILTDGGAAYPVPAGAAVSVWYSGASGEGNYTDIGADSAVSVSGNEITVELITQMLTNYGDGKLCLAINTADGDQIGTWNIPYMVEPLPGMGSAAAQAYFTAFSQAVENLPYPDASLSVSGKAADAGAVGTALAGKAPAGYGLGESPIRITNVSQLDSYSENGWYRCKFPEAVGFDDVWCYEANLHVTRTGDANWTQELFIAGQTLPIARTCQPDWRSEWKRASAPAGYGYGEKLTYVNTQDSDGSLLESYLDSNFIKQENAQKVFRFSDFASYPDCAMSSLGGFADLQVANAAAAILTGYFYNASGGISMATKQKVHGVWYDWVDCSPSAFAPSGYGLGDINGMETLVNWVGINDVATKPGWYKVAFSLNSISNWTLRVDTDGTNIFQEYKGIYNGTEVVMHRSKVDGVWCEFEWVNPPMIPGVEYRTTERWNGKAVYTMKFNTGALVNGGTFGFRSGGGELVRHFAKANGYTLPYYDGGDLGGNWSMWCNCSDTTFTGYMGSSLSSLEFTVQVWYTKE